MRSVLVVLIIVLFLILSLPLFLIMRLVGLFSRHAMAAGSQTIIAWIFRIVLKCAGAHLTVKGVENVPKDRAVLYAANHRGYADVAIGYATVPTLTGFIAKKEIKKIVGLSWWMSNMNCLFLDRTDMRNGMQTILGAIELVKQGYSIFVMPEGTRNHTDSLLPFRDGSFKIAEKSGCPIIPVAITNSDGIYELHRPWVRAADVSIHYGEPIFVENLSREERKQLGTRVRTAIEDLLEAN